MNSKILKYVSVGIGALCALVAVFNFVLAIIQLTHINTDNSAKLNIYYVLVSVLTLAITVGFAFFAYYLIMAYFKKGEAADFEKLPALVYAGGQFMLSLLVMIMWEGYKDSRTWILFIFAILVIVAYIVSLNQQDAKNKAIVSIVMGFLAFVLATVALSRNGGLSLVCDLFSMFTMMGIIGFYVLKLIPTNDKKEEKEETKKEEE